MGTDGTGTGKAANNHRVASWDEVAEALTEIPVSIRAARRSRALSLREVSEQTGVGFATISRIEHGDGYNSRVLPALLAWLSEPSKPPPDPPPPTAEAT
jgi:ribosome-binding protein aMBF1 (putative translation factor)